MTPTTGPKSRLIMPSRRILRLQRRTTAAVVLLTLGLGALAMLLPVAAVAQQVADRWNSGRWAEVKVVERCEFDAGTGDILACTGRWKVAGEQVTGQIHGTLRDIGRDPNPSKATFRMWVVGADAYGEHAINPWPVRILGMGRDPVLWGGLGLVVLGLAVLPTRRAWLRTPSEESLSEDLVIRLSTHPAHGRAWLVPVGLLGGPALVGLGAWIATRPQLPIVIVLAGSAVALAGLGLGFRLTWLGLRRPLAVDLGLYEGGLVLEYARHTDVVLWDDVVRIDTGVADSRKPNPRIDITLHLVTGRSLPLPQVDHQHSLAAHLRLHEPTILVDGSPTGSI
ncbi:hypothetical protein ACFV9G_08675 [Nocardioides sp. NPDC059952]|uniref:hypothetical protein n=1 Tax=Nocardioides sp. NPDC059952 TaxID=3347014 RepID=UPI00366302A5